MNSERAAHRSSEPTSRVLLIGPGGARSAPDPDELPHPDFVERVLAYAIFDVATLAAAA